MINLFHKHQWVFQAKHNHCQENLWFCLICRKYYVQHYGLGIGYVTKFQKYFLESFN